MQRGSNQSIVLENGLRTAIRIGFPRQPRPRSCTRSSPGCSFRHHPSRPQADMALPTAEPSHCRGRGRKVALPCPVAHSGDPAEQGLRAAWTTRDPFPILRSTGTHQPAARRRESGKATPDRNAIPLDLLASGLRRLRSGFGAPRLRPDDLHARCAPPSRAAPARPSRWSAGDARLWRLATSVSASAT